jgi:hypothetical protein
VSGVAEELPPAVWVLERVDHPKFPYRITITRGEEVVLALRAQDRWPGSRGNIFCLLEEGRELPPPVEELERVGVVSLRRYGKRLSVVLDRPSRRRCDFLFLEKHYKRKPGTYVQVFWQTQTALTVRRPRVRFALRPLTGLHLLIDAQERYPWKFPGCRTERRNLPIGDYALVWGEELVAVIERKTFSNLLRDLSDLQILHQKLGELETYPLAAVVVEAAYSDFLKPEKVKPLNVSYCVQALAELAVLHPRAPLLFLGNRKLAQAWAQAFFAAAASRAREESQPRLPNRP